MNIFQDLFQKALVFVTSVVIGVISVFSGQPNLSVVKDIPTPSSTEQTIVALATPSATPSATPKVTNKETKTTKITQKDQWTFTKDQYEVSLSNLKYETKEVRPGMDSKVDYVNADFTIKNISVEPFITGFRGGNCQIFKDGQPTNFRLGSFMSEIFPKALLPGESTTIPFESWFVSGQEYDSQGNLLKPPPGLRIKSCSLSPLIKNQEIVEPKVLDFSN